MESNSDFPQMEQKNMKVESSPKSTNESDKDQGNLFQGYWKENHQKRDNFFLSSQIACVACERLELLKTQIHVVIFFVHLSFLVSELFLVSMVLTNFLMNFLMIFFDKFFDKFFLRIFLFFDKICWRLWDQSTFNLVSWMDPCT